MYAPAMCVMGDLGIRAITCVCGRGPCGRQEEVGVCTLNPRMMKNFISTGCF